MYACRTYQWRHWKLKTLVYIATKLQTTQKYFLLILLEKVSILGWDWQKEGKKLGFCFSNLMALMSILKLNELLVCGYFLALWCLLPYTSTMKNYFRSSLDTIVKWQKVRLEKEINIFALKPLCWKFFRHPWMLEHSLCLY